MRLQARPQQIVGKHGLNLLDVLSFLFLCKHLEEVEEEDLTAVLQRLAEVEEEAGLD